MPLCADGKEDMFYPFDVRYLDLLNVWKLNMHQFFACIDCEFNSSHFSSKAV